MQYARKVRGAQQQARQTEIDGVLMALGNITIGWAGIGLILNTFIEAHHNQLGKPIRKEIPRDFTQKLDYIKKAERDPRWTPERRQELTQMRLELAALNQKRKNIAHGLLYRRGPKWVIHVAKEEGDSLMRKDIPHTAQDIHDFAGEVSDIGGRLSRFFMPLIDQR
jgi:hypothetical protein